MVIKFTGVGGQVSKDVSLNGEKVKEVKHFSIGSKPGGKVKVS